MDTLPSPKLDVAQISALEALIRDNVRDIPDFPKPGILFRDITPVLSNSASLSAALDLHTDRAVQLGPIDKVVGIESRGFLFGMALAERLDVGFVLIRKPGKLPGKTIEVAYDLEYGTDRLEIHADALAESERVLLIDDLLATGGTASAGIELCTRLGSEIVAAMFLIELGGLQGRKRLEPTRVESIIRYE